MSCVIGKHALRSVSLSHPKKDCRAGPHQYPSLGVKPTIKLYSVAFTDYILQSVSYQKKDWWGPVLSRNFVTGGCAAIDRRLRTLAPGVGIGVKIGGF